MMTELNDAWQSALVQWQEPKHHDLLLGLAAKHEQFAWLAAKYRSAAWSNPSDPIAPDRMQRVLRAAAIVAFAKPPATREPTPKLLRSAAAILVGAAIATILGLYVTEHRVHQHATISRHP